MHVKSIKATPKIIEIQGLNEITFYQSQKISDNTGFEVFTLVSIANQEVEDGFGGRKCVKGGKVQRTFQYWWE